MDAHQAHRRLEVMQVGTLVQLLRHLSPPNARVDLQALSAGTSLVIGACVLYLVLGLTVVGLVLILRANF